MLKGEYTWRETEKQVLLAVPLKGASPKSIDVFAAELILKVSFPPYLINLDLFDAVDENRSKATIKNGALNLKLTKKEPKLWGTLLAEGSREELQARREASIEERAKQQDALQEKVRDRRHEDERKALRKQMSLEHAERQHIEDLQTDEKRVAEEEVYATFARMEAARAESQGARAPAASKAKRAAPAAAPVAAPAPGSSDIFDQGDIELCDEDGAVAGDGADAPADEEPAEVPAPRTEGTNKVTFGFTPRIFPTPARESKAAEENEWITKNRAHLRKNKALVGTVDALDFGETDPAWLKSKGDEFYRGGDFRSAISAYTSALELDPEMVACLSNRAACFLRVAELRECIDDCTAALKLRESEDAPTIDAPTEVKLLVRRGTALCQQGSFEASLADYRAATALDSNPSLVADVDRLSSLAECDALKKQADARFGAGSIAEAVEIYTSALALEPSFVSCISNRAACHFALGDMPSAIVDCTAALDLLSMDVSQSIGPSSKDTVPSGPVPPAGSDTRRQWVLKTLVRRGAAHARHGDHDGAIADYETALAIDTANAALAADLEKIRADREAQAVAEPE